MELKDIPGQEKIKSYFLRLVSENRIPHALLLTGPSGAAKLSLALGLTASEPEAESGKKDSQEDAVL